jgi:Tfp pilus assembly protein PilN
VLTTLQRDGRTLRPEDLDRADAEVEVIVELDAGAVTAWLRTLTAVRLVMATRLGITTEAEQDDDPRFGVYNWLGFRSKACSRRSTTERRDRHGTSTTIVASDCG